MTLIEKIVMWLRTQTGPVPEADIVARFAPPRATTPLTEAKRRQALAIARHRRGFIVKRLREAVGDGTLSREGDGFLPRPPRLRPNKTPVMPVIFEMLRRAPDNTLLESEIAAEMAKNGVSLDRLRNNIAGRIARGQIERTGVGDARAYKLLPQDVADRRVMSWDEAREQTTASRVAAAESLWASLMAGRRYEDHPRANLNFNPARFDRPAQVVSRNSTAQSVIEARP